MDDEEYAVDAGDSAVLSDAPALPEHQRYVFALQVLQEDASRINLLQTHDHF